MRIDQDPAKPCRFLEQRGNEYYCQVRDWEDQGDEKSLGDMSEWELKYYLEQCKSYPEPNDKVHWDESLPGGCGYSRSEI